LARGRDAQYRPAMLDARPLKDVAAWIDDYRQFWAGSFDALDEFLAAPKQQSAGPAIADEEDAE
jgi:hypothetical protein